jgi:dihydrofolate synthase/folylpolyglutamate synthase
LPSLFGPHQVANAATAAAGLRRLKAIAISREAIAKGLTTAVWPARLQRLISGRLVDLAGQDAELWVDGGHNASAGEMLAQVCGGWNDRPLDLVVGMMNTKDPKGFARPLAPYVRRAICLSIPGEKNTLAGEEAARVLTGVGIEASVGSGIEEAIKTLAAGTPSRILICGSLYLAGRVLAANEREARPVS